MPATIAMAIALGLFATPALASGGATGSSRSLAVVAVALLVASLAAVIARKIGLAPVVGEIVAGCALGAVGRGLFGPLGSIASDPLLETLAEIGIVVLMFEAGVRGTVGDVVRVARPALIVAGAGVLFPVLLGAVMLRVFVDGESPTGQLFLASALAATSVGITARVLQSVNADRTPEARIIVGAAVLDDVLGLLVLAAVVAIATGGAITAAAVAIILAKALGFLSAAIALGHFFAGRVLALPERIAPVEWATTLTLALGLAFLASAGAAWAGLAPLIGAFAAGLVLDELQVRVGMEPGRSLGSYVAPVAAFLGPLFFVRVGASIDLGALFTPFALLVGLGLTVVAIVGKVGAGLLVKSRTLDGLAIGIGMAPRGEVGLIFLELGRRLPDPAHPALTPRAYAAGMLMVLATTLIGPLWLTARLQKTRAAKLKLEELKST